ncbi:ATP-binding protein [Leminorella grimontii]|uniref:AAA family ATPase n=1 Tax=Leminorella grimontii TaxID=82981 RepID=UPI0032205AD1
MMTRENLLLIFSGLPGVGKSTIAKALAARTQAVYLRIDSAEQAIRRSDVLRNDVGIAGYEVCGALAKDNLALGHCVIADCVNPVDWSRMRWREIAQEAGVVSLDVEFVCSDEDEHRQRVEARRSEVPGLVLPTWRQIMHEREYWPWKEPRIVIDTAGKGVDACIDELLTHLKACD